MDKVEFKRHIYYMESIDLKIESLKFSEKVAFLLQPIDGLEKDFVIDSIGFTNADKENVFVKGKFETEESFNKFVNKTK